MDEDPYRVLGVAADATAEQIRQAYRDLARVWHPDRFQSDPRLQQIAQDRLREIIAAYHTLKDRAQTEEPSRRATTVSEQPGPAPPAPPSEMSGFATRPLSEHFGLLRILGDRKLLFGAGVAVGSLIVFGAALRIGPLLRPPVFDFDLVAGRARITRPQILAPARILDPASDVKTAADAITEWARGEVLDLWKPESANASGTPVTIAQTIPATSQRSRSTKRHVESADSKTPLQIANGAELLTTGRLSGAGELRFMNNTDLEEVATLLRRSAAVRAIYIKPRSHAILRSIETGIYDVHLEFGTNLDLRRLRFQEDVFVPDPVGPFEFFSITTASGTLGQHYEVVVNPSSAPPSHVRQVLH